MLLTEPGEQAECCAKQQVKEPAIQALSQAVAIH
jgi:hypothetical protein